MITASAPGKVFLLGEYAVLSGHGALIGAVDKRVHVTFVEDGGDVLRVKGSLLQVNLQSATLLEALEGPASRVVAGVLASGRFAGGELTVDSSELFEDGRKLGYGSSAAVVVAVAAAMGKADFATCKRWHNRAQKTEGSGGDIAASLLGNVAWLAGETIERVNARPPLAILQHTEAASTPKLVGAVQAYAAGDAAGYKQHMKHLGALALQAKVFLAADNIAGFVAVVERANAALAALGKDAQMPILTPFHQACAARVEALGGACKPAGAGGGDISLIAAPSEDVLARIIEELKPYAQRCVLSDHGVSVTAS